MARVALLTAVTVETTDTQHAGLWASIHAARASSSEIKVNKQALFHLLNDHAELVRQYETRGLLHKKS